MTGDIIYKTGDDGIVRGYDLMSGELVHRSDNLEPIIRTPYTLDTARKILDHVRNGETVSAIGSKSEFPSAAVIFHWLQKHPDFKEAMEQARLDRAEMFHDKALKAAEGVTEKDEVPAARLLVDTYKWAAEKGDKNRFGSTKIDVDVTKQDIIVMDTGIDRSKNYEEPIDGEFVTISKEADDECSEPEEAVGDAAPLDGDQVASGEGDDGDEQVPTSSLQDTMHTEDKGTDILGKRLIIDTGDSVED